MGLYCKRPHGEVLPDFASPAPGWASLPIKTRALRKGDGPGILPGCRLVVSFLHPNSACCERLALRDALSNLPGTGYASSVAQR